LVGISVLATCLGFGKYVSDLHDRDVFGWLVFSALITMLISAVSVLPVAVAALHARRKFLALTIVLGTNSLVVATYIAIVSLIVRREPDLDEVAPEALALVLSFTVCLAFPLLILRRLGYGLTWGRESSG
jgi:hypothetical protein